MSLACKYCSKQFRKLVIKEKHEYEQVCLNEKSRTYCKICDIHVDSNSDYREHLISRTHLNNIGHMNIDNLNILKIQQDSKINIIASIDPILAECKPANTEEQVKIFFNDGSIAKVMVNNLDINEIGMSSADKQIRDTELANMTGAGLTYKDLVEHERGIAKPTPRQEKIMDYLAKFQGTGAMEMAGKFRIILEKIGMDDADFLGTHIRNCSKLTVESRQIYGAYLDEFIRKLTGLVIKGETIYRDMDLFSFVARLTK